MNRLKLFFRGIRQLWVMLIDLSLLEDHREILEDHQEIRRFYRYADVLQNQQQKNRQMSSDIATIRKMMERHWNEG